MPTVTGNVADVGIAVPELARAVFRLEGIAFDTGGIAHVDEVLQAPVDATGAFSAALPDYVAQPRPVPLWFGVAWWERASDVQFGRPARTMWLDRPIYVPSGTSTLLSLVDKETGNDRVFLTIIEPDLSQSTGFQLVDGRYLYRRKDMA